MKLASKISEDLVSLANNTIKNFPGLKKIVILERTQRFDKNSQVSDYGNFALHSYLKQHLVTEKIKIKSHIFEQTEIEMIYGTPNYSKGWGGFQQKGPMEKEKYTASIIKIIGKTLGSHEVSTQTEVKPSKAIETQTPDCIAK